MARQTKAIIWAFLVSVWATRISGAEPTAAASPEHQLQLSRTTTADGRPIKFLKSPKPPFPYGLEREVLATRNLRYNAIVKLTVDHGKIVRVVPAGGNLGLSQHLARAVQTSWVADPSMHGDYTLPLKFQMRASETQMEPRFPTNARAPSVPVR